MMKQVELLDLILKTLYDEPDQEGFVMDLLKSKNVEVSTIEAQRLARRLADERLVKYTSTSSGEWVEIKSEGKEFVEGDSFSRTGQPIVNYNYISHSPNANLVNHSNQVTINQNHSTIKQVLQKLEEVVNTNKDIDDTKRQEIQECLQEVKQGIDSGGKPKYALKSLIDMAAGVSSITDLTLQLMGLL